MTLENNTSQCDTVQLLIPRQGQLADYSYLAWALVLDQTLAAPRMKDTKPEFRPLQMTRGVHPIMKHANDGDAVVRDTKINHMPLDIAAAIPKTNMVTGWCGHRRIG